MISFDNLRTIGIPEWAAEKLISAPSDACKLYIYGLLRNSVEDVYVISQETGLKEASLFEAANALKSLGLWRDGGDVSTFEYVLSEKKEKLPAELYADRDYNLGLQALFKDRVLTYRDYETFYELRDNYGMPELVVYMLIEHCINTHKAKGRLPMVYIRDKGRDWAEREINTVDAAEQRMTVERGAEEGLKDVLRMLGIDRRSPSEEERKLYDKWIREWGFSIDGINAAMAKTTGAQFPTMKYLDSILKDLHENNRHTFIEVSEHIQNIDELDDCIKKVLRSLGAPKLTVTEQMRHYYRRFKNIGFGNEAICYAATLAQEEGNATWPNLSIKLSTWSGKKAHSLDEIKTMLSEEARKRARAAEVYKIAGKSGTPGTKVCDSIDRLFVKFGDELVYFAAECACETDKPAGYMKKLLDSWAADGVKSVAEAKKAREKFGVSKKDDRKGSPKFMEREFNNDDLAEFLEDSLRDSLEDDEG